MKIKKAAPNGNGIKTHCKNTNNIRYCKTPAVNHLEKPANKSNAILQNIEQFFEWVNKNFVGYEYN